MVGIVEVLQIDASVRAVHKYGYRDARVLEAALIQSGGEAAPMAEIEDEFGLLVWLLRRRGADGEWMRRNSVSSTKIWAFCLTPYSKQVRSQG